MNRLKNKTAIVTGAAQGLGYAIAKRFCEQGAAVMITDLNAEKGEQAANTIRQQTGGACAFLQQDVSDEASWPALLAATEQQFGALHILVNNAGIVKTAPIETETLAGWRATQAVNLDAVFLGTQMAVRAMKNSGGSVINISSIEGLVGEPNIPAYNASKGGVRLLTKSAALYCAEQRYPVRVNSVHPGFILTDMVQQGLDTVGEQAWQAARQAIPVGELGEPDDIAWAAVFLASDESKYMTGSELVIDGGYTAR
jgi:NAD(P)-dependent dehydrogenase (short-subunit alcohol dehydrogenase family)